MPLNFPSDTSAPYVDSVSGLKYIFNSAIGAWETAIQPPAVISDSAPNINIPGFLWWDSDDGELGGRLKVLYDDGSSTQWVDATPIPDPPTTFMAPNAPAGATVGDLWYDTVDGRLYVWYDDGDSQQWVDASPSPDRGGRAFQSMISVGTAPPDGPKEGDLWFNSSEGNLFIYYTDVDSQQWVVCQSFDVVTDAVETLQTSGALQISGTAKNVNLSIRDASSTQAGVARLATTAEATAGTATDVALTPAALKEAIATYVSGTVEYATNAETVAGTHSSKAVTPAALAAALPSLGTSNPTGTILEFASTTPPTGYLACNGSAVSRTTYSALFSVIGTSFGVGNTSTTFNLPTLAHANAKLIYCIKT